MRPISRHCEQPIWNSRAGAGGPDPQRPKVLAAPSEYVAQRSAAVVGALVHGFGEAKEQPHLLDGELGRLLGQWSHDVSPELVEFARQRPGLVPVEETAGTADGLQPFVDLVRQRRDVLLRRERHADGAGEKRIGFRLGEDEGSQALRA